MKELPVEQPLTEAEKKMRIERYVVLAEELSERGECFPFPGLDEESYAMLKAVDSEYPGYSTPTDEIIARMKKEGFTVVLGKDHKSGNIFIAPFFSDTVGDYLLPRHLEITEDMDPKLKDLILISRSIFQG